MDKYDRQVRVWSQDGQKTLGAAHVVILGVTLATTEAAKNLVLAGVKTVTIISSETVTVEDIRKNFFLEDSSEGKNLAIAVASLLSELNEDVDVTGTDAFDNLARDYPAVSIYISSGAQMISDQKEVPLIQVDSMGLYGRVRLKAEELTVLQSHPEPAAAVDLRFSNLWPELKHYVESLSLEEMDDFEHAHVPSALILAKAFTLFELREAPGLTRPVSRETKAEFKQFLRDLARSYDEENFEEAVNQSWRVWQDAVPQGLIDLMEYVPISKTEPFWILVAALKKFIEIYGVLPLSGKIPDMNTDTQQYNRLREIYKHKAEVDRKKLQELATCPISDDFVHIFCENCRHIQAVVQKSPEDVDAPDPVVAAFDNALLKQHDNRQVDNMSRGSSMDAELYAELLEIKGEELPTVAAIVGGIASQEALKIIMSHHTPIIGVILFNGSSHTTVTDQEKMKLLNG